MTALAEVLGDNEIGDYQVSILENRPSHEVRLRINEVFNQAGGDDLVLLYFSGHGVKDEAGRLHLVTTDTRRTLLAATAVSAHFVREIVDHSPARKIVVWLDCCFGGAFPAGMIPKAEGAVDVLPQLAGSGRGCAVMTASTSIQFAFEPGDRLSGQAKPSVFTGAIVAGLRTGDADRNDDGEIDANELYRYVYDQVRAITPGQTPTRNDQVTGELYIAHSRRGMWLHPDLPAEIRRNLRSTNRFFREAAVHALVELAGSADPGTHAMARHTLDRLRAGPDGDLVRRIDVSPTPPPRTAEPTSEPRTKPPEPETRQEPTPLPSLHDEAPQRLALPEHRVLAPKVITDFALAILSVLLTAAIIAIGVRIGPGFLTDDRGWLIALSGVVAATFTAYRFVTLRMSLRRERASPGVTLFKGSGLAGEVTFQPNGSRLIAGVGARAYMWNTKSWAESEAAGNVRGGRCLRFDPAGNLLAGVSGHTIQILETDRWSTVATLAGHPAATIESLAFSPDGSTLASCGEDGEIGIWNTSDWSVLNRFRGHGRGGGPLAFSPDGDLLASAGADATVGLWDTVSWQRVRTLFGEGAEALSMAFSPDGSVLATARTDRTIKVWDTATWEPALTIVDTPTGSGAMTFSPNSDLFAYACADGGIALVRTASWSTAARSTTFVLDGHHGAVTSLAFSPDGSLLASISLDRTIKLWPVKWPHPRASTVG